MTSARSSMTPRTASVRTPARGMPARTRRAAVRPATSMVCFSDPPSARITGNGPRFAMTDLLLSIVSVALVTFALAFWVWLKMAQVQAGYDLFRLQTEVMDLRQANNALVIEQTSLLRPERLDRLAKERLGMAAPTKAQIRRLYVEETP